MSERFEWLDKKLKEMPKPNLSHEQKQILHHSMMVFYEHRNRKWFWKDWLTKLSVSLGGLTVLSLIFIMMSGLLIHKTAVNHNGMLDTKPKWFVLLNKSYTQGEVTQLQYSKSQLISIQLMVETNFHLKNDSSDDPDSPHQPNVPITLKLRTPLLKKGVHFSLGSELIVANAQYTLNSKDRKRTFWGADTIYYRKGDKFYDLNGDLAEGTFAKKASFREGNLVLDTLSGQTPFLNSGFQQFFQGGRIVYLRKQLVYRIANLKGDSLYEIDKSTDDGQTWSKQSTSTFNSPVGISFNTENTGFIVNNASADRETPTLSVTNDGGRDWLNTTLPIPEQFSFAKGYHRLAQFPVFFTSLVGAMPIFGHSNQDSPNLFLYMLVTEDWGNTWKAIPNVTTHHEYKDIIWDVQGNFVSLQYNNREITITGS